MDNNGVQEVKAEIQKSKAPMGKEKTMPRKIQKDERRGPLIK